MSKCEGDDCICAGLVCTPRPPDEVEFEVTFTISGIPYHGFAFVKRTISDCVGRCAPKGYATAFGSIPEANLTVAVARREPITQAELTRVGEAFRIGRECKS